MIYRQLSNLTQSISRVKTELHALESARDKLEFAQAALINYVLETIGRKELPESQLIDQALRAGHSRDDVESAVRQLLVEKRVVKADDRLAVRQLSRPCE